MGRSFKSQVIISDLEGNIKYTIDTRMFIKTLCITKNGKLVIGQKNMWMQVATKHKIGQY